MPRQLLDWNSVSLPPRTRLDSAPVRVETEDFAIDFETRTAWTARDESVELTAMQWRLLEFFAQNPGRTLTHTQLLHAGWGFRDETDVDYVAVVVGQIRKKLEPEPTRPRYVLTVPGQGFRFLLTDGSGREPDAAELPAPTPSSWSSMRSRTRSTRCRSSSGPVSSGCSVTSALYPRCCPGSARVGSTTILTSRTRSAARW